MTASRQFRFTLGPSRRLAGIILVAHAAAASSAALALGHPFGPMLAVLLVGLGTAAAWSRALLLSPHSVRAIEITETGEALLERADGARLEGTIGRRRHVSRYWVAMMVRGAAAKPAVEPLLIAGDMLDESSFRAVRMWALWGRLPRFSPARRGH